MWINRRVEADQIAEFVPVEPGWTKDRDRKAETAVETDHASRVDTGPDMKPPRPHLQPTADDQCHEEAALAVAGGARHRDPVDLNDLAWRLDGDTKDRFDWQRQTWCGEDHP